MPSYDDTIFALATAPGRSAIAVVRISGPDALATGSLFDFDVPPHRQASRRDLRCDNQVVDQALVIVFEGPRSYTGEDLVELHLHGGRAVLDAVTARLAAAGTFRFAAPGEFSKRAVLNGRIDLTAAEAVNDLVNAETEAQRAQALWQLEGGLARHFDGWSNDVTRARAHIEAYIDFPEEDIPAAVTDRVSGELARVHAEMTAFLADNRRGERLREGLRIAVVGPPNAGKSSFVNWLSEREAAIVTDQAGTTRDVIEVPLNLGGFPVIVADTAGLRRDAGRVEAIGVQRALDWAANADLKLFIGDATAPAALMGQGFALDAETADIVAFNKTDLVDDGWAPQPGHLAMSVRRGDGLDQVLQRLTGTAREMLDTRAGPAVTRVRHRVALQAAIAGLEAALSGLRDNAGPEIVAEDLRHSGVALGDVTGAVGIEDLLDIVFRDFCIGK